MDTGNTAAPLKSGLEISASIGVEGRTQESIDKLQALLRELGIAASLTSIAIGHVFSNAGELNPARVVAAEKANRAKRMGALEAFVDSPKQFNAEKDGFRWRLAKALLSELRLEAALEELDRAEALEQVRMQLALEALKAVLARGVAAVYAGPRAAEMAQETANELEAA